MTEDDAVDRVRRELAQLHRADTAPEVPPDVTARIVAALTSAPPVSTASAAPVPGARIVAVITAAVTVGLLAAARRRKRPAR